MSKILSALILANAFCVPTILAADPHAAAARPHVAATLHASRDCGLLDPTCDDGVHRG